MYNVLWGHDLLYSYTVLIYHTISDTFIYHYIFLYLHFSFVQLKFNFINETITAKIFLLIQGGHVKKCKQILKVNINNNSRY